MPLDPEVRALLERRAAVSEVEPASVAEARAQSIAARAAVPVNEREPVEHVIELSIPGPAGALPARAYVPRGGSALPVLVYLHGGGWVVGDMELIDHSCRAFANAAACVVVTVNYRLAPEHKFPAGLEDVYATVAWVERNATAIGGDADRIAVGGSSAGGNLAAAVALMARDRGGPAIKFQLLVIPVIDHSFDTPSYSENATGYGLSRKKMQWYWSQYLTRESDGSHPYASPLRAADLHGLPTAHVVTAEYDPLRDEGAAYARSLSAAGVPVEYHCYPGTVHGFVNDAPAVRQGRLAIAAAARHMRRVLVRAGGVT